MSQENQNVKDNQNNAGQDKKKKVLSAFIWVMCGVILGIVIAFAMFTSGLSSASKKLSDQASVETVTETTYDTAVDGADSLMGVSTYLYEHHELIGEEAEKVKQNIINELDRIQFSNTYLQVQTGENSYETYIYNTDKECFAQDSYGYYTAIFRNDDKVIKYGDEAGAIAVGSDIELVSISKNIINSVNNGIDGITLYEMDSTNENSLWHEYRVDMIGEDAIKACYSSLGEKNAQIMYNNLTDGLEDWEPHLIMVYNWCDEEVNEPDDIFYKRLQMYCLMVEDNQEYTNWALQGYAEIGNWKLDESWYTTDFTEITGEEYDNMIMNLVNNLAEVLNTFAEENNLQEVSIDESINE